MKKGHPSIPAIYNLNYIWCYQCAGEVAWAYSKTPRGGKFPTEHQSCNVPFERGYCMIDGIFTRNALRIGIRIAKVQWGTQRLDYGPEGQSARGWLGLASVWFSPCRATIPCSGRVQSPAGFNPLRLCVVRCDNIIFAIGLPSYLQFLVKMVKMYNSSAVPGLSSYCPTLSSSNGGSIWACSLSIYSIIGAFLSEVAVSSFACSIYFLS